ncbi:MAG: hypothetical protein JW839_10195 [Candidatus Lokiarchaeota archaeon]|nr:hypothetical protein [Candidatus Lokiarchaeota archaeon]
MTEPFAESCCENSCAKSSKTPSHTLDELRKLARTRGGDCISAEYDPYHVLTWRCARGHEWQAKAASILRGHDGAPRSTFHVRSRR